MSVLKRNVVANAFGQVVAVLTSIVLVPLYVRFLGSEGFGLMGFVLSVQALAGVFDLGLSATANREISRLSAPGGTGGRDLLRTLEIAYAGLALVIFGILALASTWAARNWIQASELSMDTIVSCLSTASATIALRLEGGVYHGVLRGLEQQVKLNLFVSASTITQGVAVVWFLVAVRPSVTAFFLYQLVLVASELVLLRLLAWRELRSHGEGPARFRWSHIRGVWRFALSVNAITIFAIGIKQIDRIIISSMLPIASLGYYTAAPLATTVLPPDSGCAATAPPSPR